MPSDYDKIEWEGQDAPAEPIDIRRTRYILRCLILVMWVVAGWAGILLLITVLTKGT